MLLADEWKQSFQSKGQFRLGSFVGIYSDDSHFRMPKKILHMFTGCDPPSTLVGKSQLSKFWEMIILFINQLIRNYQGRYNLPFAERPTSTAYVFQNI